MLELDGSAGGGQLVRTAVGLAAVSGRAFEMTGVRGARDEPGLRAQHCSAVDAVAAACDADVDGVEVGSEAVTFDPGPVRGGDVRVDVGTAGSVTLVFDALLPLWTALDRPLAVTVTGGTDVRWAPPLDYWQHVTLPAVRAAGAGVAVECRRRGFYPTGGGAATLFLGPGARTPLEWTERGAFLGATVHSTAAADLADGEVAGRQAAAAVEALADAGLDARERVVRYAEAASRGSVVVVTLEYAGTRAGADALGAPGVPAEAVAREAVDAAASFHDGPGAVDAHLADQLVVPLALCGGRVAVPRVTDHVATRLELVRAFGYDVGVEDGEPPVLVGAPP